MEQPKTLTLPPRTDLFIVTGNSGIYEDKSSWIVAAYSERSYADKAVNFLQKLANKLETHEADFTEEFRRDLEELKLHDPKAWFNEHIFYAVEATKVVV
jgi:hypothetical protein